MPENSDFWYYEFKETTCYCGDFHPPTFTPNYPHETDYIFGICYWEPFPDRLINDEEAYQRAINAKYYLWINRHWNLIGKNGDPLDFLKFIVSKLNSKFRISWPNPFENHPKFHRSDCYQIYPWRELIRRHFEPRAYVADRDLIISKKLF